MAEANDNNENNNGETTTLEEWLFALEMLATVDRNNRDETIMWLRQCQRTFPYVSYGHRLRYWRPKAHVVVDILNEERDFRIHEACWDLLTLSIKLKDELDKDPSPEEKDTMAFGVQDLGIVELIRRELARDILRMEVACACIVPLTSIALREEHAEHLIQNGIVEVLIGLVRRRNEIARMAVPLLALISLTNLAIHPQSHRKLLDSGILPLAAQLIPFISSEDVQLLDFGLTACFVVCRVAGRDESGPGYDLIHSNVALFQKLLWLYDQILAAGPSGIFLGSQ